MRHIETRWRIDFDNVRRICENESLLCETAAALGADVEFIRGLIGMRKSRDIIVP